MRVLLAIVAFAAVLAFVSSTPLHTDDEYRSLYANFLEKFSKTYTPEEYERRFQIFQKNQDFVLQHNVHANEGKYTFTLEMNQFGDWTNEEYRQKMLGLRRSGKNGPSGKPIHSNVDVSALPTSFDWRTKGAVTPVKNQGQCGSCWAFSATAAMEGFYFQAGNKLTSFSEQLCVDCVNGGADTCSVGGEMHDCYLEVMKLGGEETESSYPYSGTSGGGCKYDKTKSVSIPMSGYKNVTSGDENALQAASAQRVVSVGIDASSIWFQLYSTGVYNVPTCKKAYNELDHGVTVVGYGSDNGDDYWIVKNSWGSMWGQSGYIWMSRNKSNQCGIATDATYPINSSEL